MAEIGGHVLTGRAVGEDQAQAARAVDGEHGGGVGDEIVVAAGIVDLVERAELSQHVVEQGEVVRARAEERRVEVRDVAAKLIRRVAGGVDGDHHHLNVRGVVAQRVDGALDLEHRRGAHVGAERVAEIHEHDLPLIVAEGKRAAIRGLQREVVQRLRGVEHRAPVRVSAGRQNERQQPGGERDFPRAVGRWGHQGIDSASWPDRRSLTHSQGAANWCYVGTLSPYQIDRWSIWTGNLPAANSTIPQGDMSPRPM
jgi:hypothetical protein